MKRIKKLFQQKKKEKITCNHCGVLISQTHLSRHKRTPKCFNVVSPATLADDDSSF